jgi:hypothetical protein
MLIMLQVPFKSSVAELYELIWQEGVELAVSVIPQAEMGDSFYLPLTRSVQYIFVITKFNINM